MMNIIFMGTSHFSLKVLQALHQAFHVVLVVSQPDRPVGRQQTPTPSAVSEYALQHHLPLVRPNPLTKEQEAILQVPCDFLVTASFGQYVPTPILEHPRKAAINIHASLLPSYRGASPIHQAIAQGDAETGLSFMKMVKEMDAGGVYHQVRCTLQPEWNTADLFAALGDLAATEIVPFLKRFDTYRPQPQDPSKVSVAPKLSKEDGRLNFHQPARVVHNTLRAYDEEPGCRIVLDNKEIKVYAGKVGPPTTTEASTVVKIDKSGLYIACIDNEYIITELQVPGKKKQRIDEFIQGNHWIQSGDQVRS